ncbi:MAG TPA: efflux RND transporter periplasmic adaptor subunit [Gammaproteobacteria bacterium]|nr:efflux RND transporter periplasmic adaptor subunit [Gammaproteobacteria bacterium]
MANFVSGLQGKGTAARPAAFQGFVRRNSGRLAVLVVVAAGVAVFLWWRSRPAPVDYVTESVTRGAVAESIATTGTVNPVITVQVGSYVSGVIQQINCDYNTRVKAGQLCAKIDPRPYQLKVDEDAANLASAQAQLKKDQANLAYAKAIYDRDFSLLKQNLISQDTVDSDKSKYDQATAQIGLDDATIRQRQATLNASQVNLGYTDIISPVDGIVISRNVDVGQTVAASFQTPTLFLIGKDLTKMQVDTNVSESDVGKAQAGQKATFTVEAYPNKTFEGQVTQVRRAPITVQNVVTYDVVVSVPNENLELLPGMTANTHIVKAEHDNVLRVPLQAIRFTPGGFAPDAPSQRGQAQRGESPGERSFGGRASAAGKPGGVGRANAAGRSGGAANMAGRPSGGGAADFAGKPTGGNTSSSARATVWVERNGEPHAVPVTTGLRDERYVEITGGRLEQGDQVIVSQAGGPAAASSAGADTSRRRLRF